MHAKQGPYPTDDELKMAADVIHRLPRGFLPKQIFLAIAEKVTTPTMEVAPVRFNTRGIPEIFLTKRPADDVHWPNGWHVPGTVILATDEENSLITGMERILKDELKGKFTPVGSLQRVGIKFWDIERGRELDQMHYLEVSVNDQDLPSDGAFFELDKLPDTTLWFHKVMIPEIVEAFVAASQAAHYRKEG